MSVTEGDGSGDPVGAAEKRNCIKPIDKTISDQICSGQVVTSLASAAKELIENALDAQATQIDVKLVDCGLEAIEVADNGIGIDESSFELLCKKGATNKIGNITDLTGVSSYGFRGEALNALCTLCAEVIVQTKTEEDVVGHELVFDRTGTIIKKTLKPKRTGTTVTLKSLFSTYVVRQKHLRKQKRRQYQEMVHLMQSYTLALPSLRMTCTNTENGSKKEVFNYPSEKSLTERLRQVLRPMPSYVEFVQADIIPEVALEFSVDLERYSQLRNEFMISGYISSTGTGSSSSDKQFFSVNQRPVLLPKLAKIINQVFRSYDNATAAIYPFFMLAITLPADHIDVNVTPDKRTVFIINESIIYGIVKSSLLKMFGENAFTQAKYSNSSSQMTIIFERARSSQTSTATAPDLADPPSSQELPSKFASFSQEQQQQINDDADAVDEISTVASDSGRGLKRASSDSTQANGDRPKIARRITDFFGEIDEEEINDSVAPSTQQQQPEAQGDTATNELNERTEADDECEIEQCEPCDIDNISVSEFVECSRNTSSITLTPSDVECGEQTYSQPTAGNDAALNESAAISELIESQQPEMPPLLMPPPLALHPIFNRTTTAAAAAAARPQQQPQNLESPGNAEGSTSVHHQRAPQRKRVNSGDTSTSSSTGGGRKGHQQSNPSTTVTTVNQSENLGGFAKASSLIRTSSNGQIPEVVLGEETAEEQIIRRTTMVKTNVDLIRQHFESMAPGNSKLYSGSNGINHRTFKAALDDEKAEEELKRELDKEAFRDMAIIGQFNKSFILTQLNKDVFVIDQHASDERYNFDLLLSTAYLDSQTLVSPINLVLTPYKESLLEEHMALFNQNGFRFEHNPDQPSGRRYALNSLPVFKNENYQLGSDDVEELLEMLNESEYTPRGLRPSRIKSALASEACRKSIMINDSLKIEKMRLLLDNMAITKYPWTCAHGRPTVRHLLSTNQVFLPSYNPYKIELEEEEDNFGHY